MKEWEYAALEFEVDKNSEAFISVDMEQELDSYGSDGYELKSVNVAGEKYLFLWHDQKTHSGFSWIS